MSSHLYPETSAHLLAATPGAHWLEYVDWLNALVEEPLRLDDGMAHPVGPGNGLTWNEDAVRKFACT
jgi:mandelate racemase